MKHMINEDLYIQNVSNEALNIFLKRDRKHWKAAYHRFIMNHSFGYGKVDPDIFQKILAEVKSKVRELDTEYTYAKIIVGVNK